MIKRIFILLFIISLSFAHTLVSAGESVEWLDEDKDGRNEVKLTTRKNTPIKKEIDKNGDEKIDRTLIYKNGVRFKDEIDNDYDGFIDTWMFYDKRGARQRMSKDTNKDGKPDYWRFFEKGHLVVLRERDRNFDGLVDYRSLDQMMFDNRMKVQRLLPVEIETDDDYDGVIDKYRVRGVSNPVPDKTGEKIDTSFKKSANRKKTQSSDEDLSKGKKSIQNIIDREEIVKESQENLIYE